MVKPVDVAPVRSPQDVHSIIAWHVRGKSVVEVGTRNGDGMACFAQVASSAIAVELAAAYCSKLQVRAAELQNAAGHTFSVMCKDYRTAPGLDADVFTWWQETPHLHNPAILMSLRWLQERGQIRKDAVAIMVFDTGWGDDMDDFQNLHRLGWPSWSATVDGVNERAGCLTLSSQAIRLQSRHKRNLPCYGTGTEQGWALVRRPSRDRQMESALQSCKAASSYAFGLTTLRRSSGRLQRFQGRPWLRRPEAHSLQNGTVALYLGTR